MKRETANDTLAEQNAFQG